VYGKDSATTNDYKMTKDLLKPPSRHYDFPLRSSKPTRQFLWNHSNTPVDNFQWLPPSNLYVYQNVYTHTNTPNNFLSSLGKERYFKTYRLWNRRNNTLAHLRMNSKYVTQNSIIVIWHSIRVDIIVRSYDNVFDVFF